MLLEMIVVVSFEKGLYLLGQEREEFVGSFGFHQRSRNCDLGLLQGEGLVSMQSD